MNEVFYWFSRADGTTEYQTTPAAIGRTDSATGDLVPCENGMHASPTAFDALQYATGPMLWRVTLSDERVPHGSPVDKYAARSRTYVQCVDIDKLCRRFAAMQALSVIQLWDAPQVCKDYLTDEANGIDRPDILDAARDAASAAAWDAAWDAASAAAKQQFNDLVDALFAEV